MKKPPFRVTLLHLLVLTLTMWNGLRLWTALAWKDTLTEFTASPSPTALAISSAFWLITGALLIWGMGQQKKWAANMLIWVASTYSIWYWLERLLCQNPRPNWLFAVIVNLAALGFILLNIKSLSREAHERKLENSTNE